eukprot:3378480-Pyramimonas_sp.AAC.1
MPCGTGRASALPLPPPPPRQGGESSVCVLLARDGGGGGGGARGSITVEASPQETFHEKPQP